MIPNMSEDERYLRWFREQLFKVVEMVVPPMQTDDISFDQFVVLLDDRINDLVTDEDQ